MTVSTFTWEPPPGMLPHVALKWREFYRAAASGRKGYTASPDEYRVLYVAQLGRCFICQRARGIHPEDPKGKGAQRLGWDHNHTTGKVRGLLCTKGEWSCNRILGRYKDNPDAFRRAVRYLEQPPALILAIVQQQAATLSVEERMRLAQELLGVEADHMLAKVQAGGLGARPSHIIVDEAHVAFNGQDLTPYVTKVELGHE